MRVPSIVKILMCVSLLGGIAHGTVESVAMRRTAAELTAAMSLKSNEMAEYAYQSGCTEAYIRFCGRISGLEERSQCQREGLRSCGGNAKGFRRWIEEGRKR